MDRRAQLDSLAGSLEQLVAILRLDPACQWRAHFESSLRQARDFLESGFQQDDLSSFSVSVMSVFGGAGSFNDYAPGIYERVTDGFEQVSSRVYDQALSLRVVDRVA
jgi:hypothetical protein